MLLIKPTNKTPLVRLDLDRGRLDIKGLSSPDHSISFYKPIMDNLTNCPSTPKHLVVNMCFSMFNTSSAKCIYEILKKVKTFEKSGTKIRVNWYYDEYDEDMLECGEDFSDLLSLPFCMRTTEELKVIAAQSRLKTRVLS
ncbi:MAG: DUF1987 domain-containing protein [Cyclobacteriaceae bacterium]